MEPTAALPTGQDEPNDEAETPEKTPRERLRECLAEIATHVRERSGLPYWKCDTLVRLLREEPSLVRDLIAEIETTFSPALAIKGEWKLREAGALLMLVVGRAGGPVGDRWLESVLERRLIDDCLDAFAGAAALALFEPRERPFKCESHIGSFEAFADPGQPHLPEALGFARELLTRVLRGEPHGFREPWLVRALARSIEDAETRSALLHLLEDASIEPIRKWGDLSDLGQEILERLRDSKLSSEEKTVCLERILVAALQPGKPWNHRGPESHACDALVDRPSPELTHLILDTMNDRREALAMFSLDVLCSQIARKKVDTSLEQRRMLESMVLGGDVKRAAKAAYALWGTKPDDDSIGFLIRAYHSRPEADVRWYLRRAIWNFVDGCSDDCRASSWYPRASAFLEANGQ